MGEAVAIKQTVLNILALLRHHQCGPVEVVTTLTDRITAIAPATFPGQLERAGFARWPFFSNHGLTATASWREGCPRYSLQAVEHASGVWEFDVDYINPHPSEGIAFTIGHGFEVLFNKIRRRKTDPFRVRRGLLKRGIPVGLAV